MAPSYPELADDFERIATYAYGEEEAFLTTLRAGTTILDTAIAETKQAAQQEAVRRQGVPAARHVRLPDRPHPGDRGRGRASAVDADGFRKLMAEQRTRAKADAAARKTGHADLSVYRSHPGLGRPHRMAGLPGTGDRVGGDRACSTRPAR